MKRNTKSSVTLPPDELRLIRSLKRRLKLETNVEVVRRGLHLLEETTDRQALRVAFREASKATRASLSHEVAELDHLSGEGID